MKIIPKNFVSAFAEGKILQVLFLAILGGIPWRVSANAGGLSVICCIKE